MDLLKQVQGGLATVWQKVTTAGRDYRQGAAGSAPTMSQDQLSLSPIPETREGMTKLVDMIPVKRNMSLKERNQFGPKLLAIKLQARRLGFKDIETSAGKKFSAPDHFDAIDNLRYDANISANDKAVRKAKLELLLLELRQLGSQEVVSAAKRELELYESAPKSSNP
jgi:hypothetical protein